MPILMATTDLPADTTNFGRHRLFYYAVVLAISAALHFLAWQFRDVLEQRSEPKPKPVQTIEVMLTPSPAAKGPEPGPEKKAEPKKSDPKLVPPPPRPKLKPESKPESKPRPKPEPKPQSKPLQRTEEPDPNMVEQRAESEPKPEPPPRPMEQSARSVEKPAPERSDEAPPSREADSAATKSHGGESGQTGGSKGEADEGPTTKAAYLYRPEPEYPALAKHREWEGRVVVRVKILADGRCGHAEVSASSGHDVLDEAARETVCNSWRFKPALRGGKPVESTVNIPINFKLE
jgi:protein TonB